MRLFKTLAVVGYLLAASAAHAQNWATVTASNITDLNQNKLAAGQLCFLVTDQNDTPISVGVGGGGQTLKRPFCSPVAGGAVTAFTVPNPASTQPAGIYYRITVKDTSTGQEVLRYTQVTFSGGSFNFDAYAPTNLGNFAPLTGNSVSGNLSVSGNASVTGTLGATGGMKSTSLMTAGNGNSVTLLSEQGPTAALTGNGTDQALYTYTIPANTIGPGKGIRVKVWWKHAAGSANVQYKLIWGSGSITFSNGNATASSQYFAEYVIFNNTGVQNAQHGSTFHNITGNAVTSFSPLAGSENTANSVALNFTFNVANTDQVTGGEFIVELVQ